jgi:hypothetical protein
VKVVDRMVVDALLLADPHLAILGRDDEGKVIRMSEACDDVRHFVKLSDDFILRTIQFSSTKELEPARNLVNRITARKLYKLVGEVEHLGESQNLSVCQEEVNNMIKVEKEKGVATNLSVGDIVMMKKKINFGQNEDSDNPVEKVIFFDKSGRHITYTSDEMKGIIPARPISETLLVMCRKDQGDTLAIQEAKDLFGKWFDIKFGRDSAFRKR